MTRAKQPANIVGPMVRKRRMQLEMTQSELAGQCQLVGLNISRGTLSQIEAQIRCVTDYELVLLAAALKMEVGHLLPAARPSKFNR